VTTDAAPARPPTSIWLVPGSPHRHALRRRIDELAAELGAPSFDPHITLVSGVVDDATAAAALADVARGRAPLQLTAGRTDHGPERFRCVYVTFADPRIHDLAGAVASRLGVPFDPADLAPHLSLLYGEDLDEPTRAEVARRQRLEGEVWHFDKLLASRPDGDPDDVRTWRAVATVGLGPA
jgi:2'-5' RNA ligase